MATFLLRGELLDESGRLALQAAEREVRAAGTPFIRSYTPGELPPLAHNVGFNPDTGRERC